MAISELKCAKVITRDIEVNRSYRSMKHIPKEWQYVKQNGYCGASAEYLIDGNGYCSQHAYNQLNKEFYFDEGYPIQDEIDERTLKEAGIFFDSSSGPITLNVEPDRRNTYPRIRDKGSELT